MPSLGIRVSVTNFVVGYASWVLANIMDEFYCCFLGSNGSWAMPFMVTVMVQYIVSETDKVMTATICVMLV
jgi:hypothetical protein